MEGLKLAERLKFLFVSGGLIQVLYLATRHGFSVFIGVRIARPIRRWRFSICVPLEDEIQGFPSSCRK